MKARAAAIAAVALILFVSSGPGCKKKGGGETPSSGSAVLDGHPPPQGIAETAGIIPAGALILVAAPDFGALVDRALESGPVKSYLGSRSFARFQESRLYFKLEGRYNEVMALAGTGGESGLGWLKPLAGPDAALALYDIGELKFLFVSGARAESVQQCALWAAAERGAKLSAEGADYFALGEPGSPNRLFLGFAGGRFVMGNLEDAFQKALGALGRGEAAAGSMLEEPEFNRAFPEGFEVHDLMIWLDQAALNDNSYFRRYWLAEDGDDLTWIRSAVVDIEAGRDFLREKRYYTSDAVPGKMGDFKSARCSFLFGKTPGLFEDCRELATAGDAAAMIASVIPGEAAGDSLAGVFEPARPRLGWSVSALEGRGEGYFPEIRRSVALSLEDAPVDLEKLKSLLARAYMAGFAGDAGMKTAWEKDGLAWRLAIPLFDNDGLWVEQAGDLLVVSTSAAIHKEMVSSTRPGKDKAWRLSRWPEPTAREELKKASARLAGDPGWSNSEARETMTADFGAALSVIQAATVTRKVALDKTLLVESIEYAPPAE